MPVSARTAALAAAAVALSLAPAVTPAAAPPARAVEGPAPDPLDAQAMRDMAVAIAVTAKYVDEEQALKDGYVRHGECLLNPFGPGAMGYHYVKDAYWGSTDPSKPTALVYSPETDRNGKHRLYAVEWMVSDKDQDLTTTEDRPSMFGLPFDGPMPGHWAGMPRHYDIHMWAYKENPSGRFHNWNPAVTCPGATPAAKPGATPTPALTPAHQHS
ncbi:hypothetical protein [Streptomyces sp. NPDC048603]|uniref:hypothetical protein n=1 Tax=Streptomyces sp. NPDC048603 TaxID=3365577 RepID=UPI0037226259